MAERQLLVRVLGDASKARSAFKETDEAGAESGRHAGILSGHFAALGGAIAGALTVGAVVEFGHKAIDSFKEVGKETIALQRITGDTAQHMSELRFAAEETGTSTETLEKGIKKLSQTAFAAGTIVTQTAGAHGKLHASVKAASGPFAELGIAVTDSSGKFRSTNDLLLDVAGKFKEMPGGVERSALAVKLFGKSGLEMLPFLLRGKEGLQELEHESDKFGLTLSQGQVDSIKKATLAHREMHAAMKGIEVQMGAVLFPIVAKVTEFFAGHLVPILITAGHTLAGVVGPAVEGVGKILDTVGGYVRAFFLAFTKSGEIDGLDGKFQGIVGTGNKVRKVFDEIAGVVHQLGDAFTSAWQGIQPVIDFLGGHLTEVIGGAVVGIGAAAIAFGVLGSTATEAAAAETVALAPIIAIGVGVAVLAAGVIYAYEHFKIFRAVVDDVASFFTDTVWPAINTVYHGISDGIGLVVGYFQKHWDSIEQIVFGAWKMISSYVSGGLEVIRGIVNIFVGVFTGDWGKVWDGVKGVFSGAWKMLSGVVSGGIDVIVGLVKGIGPAIASAAEHIWDGLYSGLKGVLNLIVDGWNGMADLTTFKLPKLPEWMPVVGGKGGESISLLPHLPHLAIGTSAFAGGLAVVGEHGPEIRYLPSGAGLIPPGTSQAMLSGSGSHVGATAAGAGGDVHIHLHVGQIIGSNLEQAAKQMAPALAEPVRRELLRIGLRNGQGSLWGG